MKKWSLQMTTDELAEFMQEIAELDAAYALAAEHDAKMQAECPIPNEWEDESEYWRKAGLDSRGRP